MEEIFYPSKDGKNTVHACIWRPQGQPRGVIQIIHGMCEYIERYAPFAEFLTSQGFIVCGEDHLGHGKTVKDTEDLGYFCDSRDYQTVIADIRELQLHVQEETRGLPYFIMGHSMGSFFCRNCIALFGGDFDGAIIMCTGFKSGLTLNTALAVVRMNALFTGWRNRSKAIKKLAFGAYNKKFQPERTANDWLSVNTENVDRYNADPLCGFPFTNNGYKILFSVIKAACKKKTINAVPKDLPVLFVAGDCDPVGDYGKGVIKAYTKFKKAGVKDVGMKLYATCRHEILNDNCRGEVEGDILSFLNAHIK